MTTLVKVNPAFRKNPFVFGAPLTGLINDILNTNGFGDALKAETAHLSRPAVNIIEQKDGYRLEVAAPGLSKEDFKINVEKDELTISAKKEWNKEEGEKTIRKEFHYYEFTRSFTLPETVNVENIAAAYENGVLRITLPLKEVAQVETKKVIEIA